MKKQELHGWKGGKQQKNKREKREGLDRRVVEPVASPIADN
jgi:hypothetical protein